MVAEPLAVSTIKRFVLKTYQSKKRFFSVFVVSHNLPERDFLQMHQIISICLLLDPVSKKGINLRHRTANNAVTLMALASIR